jgi:hypothetical protein
MQLVPTVTIPFPRGVRHMVPTAIARQRLTRQRLTQNPLARPEEVVAWLGAVQAQDYPGAQWALCLRMRNATGEAIERAVADGRILRTHVLRPTWHFVAPADLRWMQALTAPRVRAASARMERQHELNEALLARSTTVIADALRGGRHLTRAELGAALAAAGIPAQGVRLGLIVMRAELDAVVCSGPRRGKQFTYALVEERVPEARSLDRDEALAELTRRYFRGHGPATAQDYAWWSGLTVAEAKAGIEWLGSELAREEVEGRTSWCSASLPRTSAPSERAFLLPTYDEFLVGYAGFDLARRGGRPKGESGGFDSTLLIDGRVVGSWKRSVSSGMVSVEVMPFVSLTAAQREAVEAAAQQYGAFAGLPARATIR